MMDYFKRRLSFGDFQHELTDTVADSSTVVKTDTNSLDEQAKLIPNTEESTHSMEHNLHFDSVLYSTKDIQQETAIGFLPKQTLLKRKFKILLIIDDQQIDW